ncbi:MAG: exodeoxyribonuclease VII small subunit [Desulfovibrio sp.]|jgi:exodeoxyribonuclease VII small subunit|nr:exodeoxyribonuclease VII small subunit [Desulfovibrio sp.]
MTEFSEMNEMAEENLFERRMARLQHIVNALEADDLPLETSMSLYKEGMACARFCKERLEKARHELAVWQDGETKPFAPWEEEEPADPGGDAP